MNDEADYDADEPDYDSESRIDELEGRVDDLESEEGQTQGRKYGGSDSGCLAFPYSVGAALAVVISWEANHSVLLGLLHGLLSWVYVVYALIMHDNVKLL